jgi:hypothetical protein
MAGYMVQELSTLVMILSSISGGPFWTAPELLFENTMLTVMLRQLLIGKYEHRPNILPVPG